MGQGTGWRLLLNTKGLFHCIARSGLMGRDIGAQDGLFMISRFATKRDVRKVY